MQDTPDKNNSAFENEHAGGALSGALIRELMESPPSPEDILVVSPLLEPEEQLRDDQASIDVRLGCQFVLTHPSALGDIYEFSKEIANDGLLDIRRIYKDLYVPLGDNLVIHPHQFILATTLEYIRLPRNLMCYVVGRSTWGRLGLVVATAIGVHPKYSGTLTLELRNLGETPVRLYPGQAIAQLFFHWVDVKDGENAPPSEYSVSVELFPKSLSKARTHKKLKSLKFSKDHQ